jgi:hypothetical protein
MEHEHDWKQAGPDEVYCRVCGIEPWQRDQLDMRCEQARRAIRRDVHAARVRLGLAR